MRSTRILPILLAVLMAAPTALAEDAPAPGMKCPSVYGTWRTTHVMDKFGQPQELDPPKGRRGELMAATIDEHKAVLTWNGKRQPVTEGRKKRTFKRVYRYEQTPNYFGGLDQGGQYVSISANYDMEKSYIDEECHLIVGVYSEMGSSTHMLTHVLMVKAK